MSICGEVWQVLQQPGQRIEKLGIGPQLPQTGTNLVFTSNLPRVKKWPLRLALESSFETCSVGVDYVSLCLLILAQRCWDAPDSVCRRLPRTGRRTSAGPRGSGAGRRRSPLARPAPSPGLRVRQSRPAPQRRGPGAGPSHHCRGTRRRNLVGPWSTQARCISAIVSIIVLGICARGYCQRSHRQCRRVSCPIN